MKLPKYQFARAKLEHYIAQMSVLLPFKNSIRSTVVPGRELALHYIQEAIFYGPLATLINSAEIAEGTEIKIQLNPWATLPFVFY